MVAGRIFIVTPASDEVDVFCWLEVEAAATLAKDEEENLDEKFVKVVLDFKEDCVLLLDGDIMEEGTEADGMCCRSLYIVEKDELRGTLVAKLLFRNFRLLFLVILATHGRILAILFEAAVLIKELVELDLVAAKGNARDRLLPLPIFFELKYAEIEACLNRGVIPSE